MKEDFLRSYNILQNKLYVQKPLFAIVAILVALILLTLLTLHNVLKSNIIYNTKHRLQFYHCNNSTARNTTESRGVERLIKPAYHTKCSLRIYMA